jgi:hypothetical protein
MSTYFQIKEGIIDYFSPYLSALLLKQAVRERSTFYKGQWVVWADFDIIASAKTLARDNVDANLGQAERSIQQLTCQYRDGMVAGIYEMQYGGLERLYDRTNWASSNWASASKVRLRYNEVA